MDIVLEVKKLKKYFPVKKGIFLTKKDEVKAVDGVSFKLKEKETLGIVGESGSGKTSLARVIMQLYKADSGEIIFLGKNFNNNSLKELSFFAKNMQIVFQNPLSTLKVE